MSKLAVYRWTTFYTIFIQCKALELEVVGLHIYSMMLYRLCSMSITPSVHSQYITNNQRIFCLTTNAYIYNRPLTVQCIPAILHSTDLWIPIHKFSWIHSVVYKLQSVALEHGNRRDKTRAVLRSNNCTTPIPTPTPTPTPLQLFSFSLIIC